MKAEDRRRTILLEAAPEWLALIRKKITPSGITASLLLSGKVLLLVSSKPALEKNNARAVPQVDPNSMILDNTVGKHTLAAFKMKPGVAIPHQMATPEQNS